MRIIGVLGAFIGTAYLAWRAGWTLNHDAVWLSIPLLLAEAHGHVTYLLYLVTTWRIEPIIAGAPPRDITVDFFIPTYNEPLEVLAPTVAGAGRVRGAHETYVLDDGRRPWVKAMCDQLGAHYLTRADNHGAKAGNINAALTVTSGDVIAILDADFVPAPWFLEDTLGYFKDPDVAVVQGPQEFYNRDSFQHAGDGSDWNEQTTFYRVIQPGKNRWNAVFWCGSPSLVRRTALEEVGGVSTATITEDLHTSIAMHRRGWRIVYHNDVIARGLAPENYHAYILQRVRWAQGAMQVIRSEWYRGGLTIPQRLSYIASTTTYFDSFRKFTLLMIIPAITIFDRKPIDAPLFWFLGGWLIYFGSTQFANIVLGRGYYRWWSIEMFDLMKMFPFMQASLTLVLDRRVKFKVTPKSQGHARYLHPLMIAPLALVGLYLVAILVGGARLLGLLPNQEAEVTLAAIVWAALMATILGIIAWRTYAHATIRSSHRHAIVGRGWVSWSGVTMPVSFLNLSLSGTGITSPRPLEVGETVYVGGLWQGTTRAEVRQVRPAGQSWFVGVAFDDEDWRRIAITPAVLRSIFQDDRHEARPVPTKLAQAA